MAWNPYSNSLVRAFSNTGAPAATLTALAAVPAVLQNAARTGANATATEYQPSSGSYSSGSTAPRVDSNVIAQYDQGINQANAALGRLPGQESIGSENITNAYNSTLNTLLDARTTAERDYNTTKTQSTQDNIKARSNIDYSTGQKANSLQRLLGSRGAGSSSAARVAAPWAAANEGSRQRGQVADAFGRNMQSLDTNWSDYGKGWDRSRGELDQKLYQQRNDLQAQIGEKRSGLLSQLATLQAQRAAAAGGNPVAAAQPYLDQVNALGGQIDQLGRQFASPIAISSPTYKTPDLSAYNYEPGGAIGIGQNTSALTDTVNPYLSVLLRGRREATGGLV